jgi:hypothetical protein
MVIMNKILVLLAANTFLISPISAWSADSIGFDDNCKAASTNEWSVEKNFRFSDRGKAYQLVFSRTTDGSGSLCLVQGGSGKPVGLKYWQSEYIDQVERVSAKVFTFQIHQGNGNNSPTAKYRLNLSQPQNPQITLLKKWVTP